MGTARKSQPFDEATQRIIETVTYNCNIADAQNALENPMCIYLLKMRDYYRWSFGLPLNANIPKDKLGKWIYEKENAWEKLYDKDFLPVIINNNDYDAFDTDEINNALDGRGLHYSAGIGRGGQTHFHLGTEISFLSDRAKKIYVTSTEYARDLTAPPAHSINGSIFLRKEALLHYIWGRYEEWSWKKPKDAMSHAMRFYPFDNDPIRAINQMCGNEIFSTLLHEEGELAAGKLLTDEWEEMLVTLSNSRAEILCRAARDHLADSLVTLPTLISENNWASIHFYFANFEGFRKMIWAELFELYKKSVNENTLYFLKDYIENEAIPYWTSHTKNVLKITAQPNDKPHKSISDYFTKKVYPLE